MSSRASVRQFADAVKGRYKSIDALVNIAGLEDGGSYLTSDGFNMLMEVNVLSVALLTELLLPALRGGPMRSRPGRIVNVAADVVSTPLNASTSLTDLVDACMAANSTLANFAVSKLLLAHHAIELAKREPDVVTFAVNPGYAVEAPGVPQWMYQQFLRSPFSGWDWLLRALNISNLDIGFIERGHFICTHTLKYLDECPATYAQAGAVIGLAAALPGIDAFSGSWLDY